MIWEAWLLGGVTVVAMLEGRSSMGAVDVCASVVGRRGCVSTVAEAISISSTVRFGLAASSVGEERVMNF